MNEPEVLIPIVKFCENHRIEMAFITTLHENGLVEIIKEGDTLYVHVEKIPRLEKIVRMHYELNINLEGIEAISHLLERVESLQHENTELRNRLRVFEE